MALFHFSVTQVRRGAGQSVIASAAYRAGEKLYSEYYGETNDYTRKGGVIHTEILLPPHAPDKYRDRATLWNAVEKSEKHPKAQLAYSFDIALQTELTMEENIALAREFVQTNFIAKGMIADLAVHAPDRPAGSSTFEAPDHPEQPDTHSETRQSNPHFHVLTTMRPLNADGTFAAKQHREYVLDEHGNRIRDGDGKYVFNAVHTTDWHAPETLEAWRAAWCDLVNRRFEEKNIPCRIDHRSYARQGIDQIPTVHEGPNVRKMEAKGIRTEKGELNRWIKATNQLIRDLRKKIAALIDWMDEIREELSKPEVPPLIQLLCDHFEKRNQDAYSNKGKVCNLKQFSETINFLEQQNIHTLDELKSRVESIEAKFHALTDSLQAKSKRMDELKKLIQTAEAYKELKPIFDEMNQIHWKGRREKFAQEHDSDLRRFYAVRRTLQESIGDKKIPLATWQNEFNQLKAEYKKLSDDYVPIRDEMLKLLQVQHNVDTILKDRGLSPQHTKDQTR